MLLADIMLWTASTADGQTVADNELIRADNATPKEGSAETPGGMHGLSPTRKYSSPKGP